VVALPPAGQPALWIYSHFQATPPLPAYLPQATLVAHGDAYPGHPGYFLYRMAPQALASFPQRIYTTAPAHLLWRQSATGGYAVANSNVG